MSKCNKKEVRNLNSVKIDLLFRELITSLRGKFYTPSPFRDSFAFTTRNAVYSGRR
jgi:hypothetical protein